MHLYIAKIIWYNKDEEETNTIAGFAEDLVSFVSKIDKEFNCEILSLSIQEINSMTNELLYIPSDIVDRIIEENTY